MFGYIGVYKPELKIKEYDTFRAYYCGLCHAIKKDYSEKARLLLNYDCAFLYLLCDALTDDKPVYKEEKCFTHPFEKRHTAYGTGEDYSAAINILMGVESIRDHAQDGAGTGFRALAGIYKKDYEKAAEKYPEIEKELKIQMERLHKTERQNVPDIDEAADPSGKLLERVFLERDPDNRALGKLGYELGRWVYLIDALDDFEKDASSGSYNPFIARMGDKLTDEVKTAAEYNLNASVSGAALALDLIDIKKHEGIIKNIIYLGLYHKTELVLKGGKGRNTNGSV